MNKWCRCVATGKMLSLNNTSINFSLVYYTMKQDFTTLESYKESCYFLLCLDSWNVSTIIGMCTCVYLVILGQLTWWTTLCFLDRVLRVATPAVPTCSLIEMNEEAKFFCAWLMLVKHGFTSQWCLAHTTKVIPSTAQWQWDNWRHVNIVNSGQGLASQ